MATEQMELVRFDQHTFGVGSLANVHGLAGAFIESGASTYDASPQFAGRPDAAGRYVQSQYDPHTLSLYFATPTYADRQAVLRMLDWPNRRDPRELVALVGDPDAPTPAARSVVVERIEMVGGMASAVRATVSSPDLAWRALSPTQTPTLTLTEAPGAVAILNPGHTTVQPTVEFGWDAQRDAGVHSPTEGWRYRRQVTITNTTDLNWEREAWCVDLGDTAALVTGSKALLSGDDVRVWHEGREMPRTLVNWNSTRGFLWFVCTIPSGESITVDIAYGNPSATAPTDLSTKTGADLDTYVAYDLDGFYGVADSGSSTTLVDAAANIATADDNRWNYGYVQIISGTGAGQGRGISDFAQGTGTFTVDRPWSTNPAAGSVYVVWMSGIHLDGGKATSGATTTLTDTSASFPVDDDGVGLLVGGTVHIIGGAQAGASRTITSHDEDTLSFAALPGALDNTSVYRVERYGVHNYVVNENLGGATHRGGWRISKYYSQPGDVWFGDKVPGGWQPVSYIPDPADDISQTSFVDLGSYGDHDDSYWPILDAWRQVRQDAALPEEGQGDGVSLYDPRGFQAILFDYLIQNEEDPETGDGIGRFTFAAIGPGGGPWEDLVTDTAPHANFATAADRWVALNDTGDPYVRLYMGMLPADGVAIPNRVAASADARVRWNGVLQTHLALDGIGGLDDSILSWGSEVDVYHLNPVARTDGGHEPRPPYCEATFNRVLLEAGQTLRLSLDTEATDPLCAIYDGGVVVAETPWAATLERVDRELWQTEDEDRSSRAVDLLPVRAHDEDGGRIANPTFATDAANWTPVAITGGVTVAWSRDAGVFADVAGSLKGVVSAAPASTWQTAVESDLFPVAPGEAMDVAFALRSTSTSLSVAVALVGYDDADVATGDTLATNCTFPTAGAWYTFAVGGFMGVPTGDTTQAKLRFTIGGPSSTTGTVYVDAIAEGWTVLHVAEAEPGTITVDVSTLPRYLD